MNHACCSEKPKPKPQVVVLGRNLTNIEIMCFVPVKKERHDLRLAVPLENSLTCGM